MMAQVALALVLASGGGAASAPLTRDVEIAPEVRIGDVRPSTLVFEDVEVPSNRGAIVRVFANLPEGTADTTTKSPHYLGYFAVVPEKRDGPPTTRTLRATVLVRRQLSSTDGLRVTLVPVDRAGALIKDLKLGVGRIVLTGDHPP